MEGEAEIKKTVGRPSTKIKFINAFVRAEQFCDEFQYDGYFDDIKDDKTHDYIEYFKEDDDVIQLFLHILKKHDTTYHCLYYIHELHTGKKSNIKMSHISDTFVEKYFDSVVSSE